MTTASTSLQSFFFFFLIRRPPPTSTLFPHTTLSRPPADLAGAPWMRAATFEEFKQVAERTYILAKLKENDWNVSVTARTLDMPRSNLYKKIERYGLAREA